MFNSSPVFTFSSNQIGFKRFIKNNKSFALIDFWKKKNILSYEMILFNFDF